MVAGVNVEGTNKFLQDVANVAALHHEVLEKAVAEVLSLDQTQRVFITRRQHAVRVVQRTFRALKERKMRKTAASKIQRGWRKRQERPTTSSLSSSSSSYADDFDDYDDDDFESSGGDADVSNDALDKKPDPMRGKFRALANATYVLRELDFIL